MQKPITIGCWKQCLRTAIAGLLTLFISFVHSQVPKLNSNSTASSTVYLDFDGEEIRGTAWNWEDAILAKSAGLNQSLIAEIFSRVASDFCIFNINITTDSLKYATAPVAKRIRIIITPTSQWYGTKAGGIAFVNSFTWGDGTPAWVFSDLLGKNAKYIGEAASHEIGHTLGLQHQCIFDEDCNMLSEYSEGKGDGETGWAPIMGVGYYKNLTTWHVGPNIEGCSVIQNDIEIISNGENNIGLRNDDHGNSMLTATTLNFRNTDFHSNGLISTSTDQDVFRFVLDKNALFKTTVEPDHVGIGNDGANIDIRLCLLTSDGDTIGSFNPKNLLSTSVDTNLSAGTYFMVIDGVENENVDDYGSIGYYSITGSLQSVLPLTSLVLKGGINNNMHEVSWTFEANEPIGTVAVECSSDGVVFSTLSSMAPSELQYKYRPFGNRLLYYRVKMTTIQDGKSYYSNVVVLKCTTAGNVSLFSNLIRSTVEVNTTDKYGYQLSDVSGRLLQRGKLNTGLNNIAISSLQKGILLLRIYNGNEQHLFRLIKQ